MSKQLIELTEAELDLVGGGNIDPGGPVKGLMPERRHEHLVHHPLPENGHGNEVNVNPIVVGMHF